MRMMFVVIMCAVMMFQTSCSRKDKDREPGVDIDQVADDGSTRDRYIFREQIQKENESKEKQKREEFR